MSQTPPIPAPPPRPPARGKKKSVEPGASPVVTLLGALAIGAVMGALAYRFLPFIADYFDYWVAKLFS